MLIADCEQVSGAGSQESEGGDHAHASVAKQDNNTQKKRHTGERGRHREGGNTGKQQEDLSYGVTVTAMLCKSKASVNRQESKSE